MAELALGVLIMVASVYSAAAAAKLRGRQAYAAFRRGFSTAALIPRRLIPVVAGLLVGCETACASCLTAAAVLIAARMPDATGVATVALCAATLFTAALTTGVAMIIRRGTEATCACFGAASSREIGLPHLVRNVSLLVVLMAGLAASAAAHSPVPPQADIVVVFGAIVAALLLIRFDDLIMVFRPLPVNRK